MQRLRVLSSRPRELEVESNRGSDASLSNASKNECATTRDAVNSVTNQSHEEGKSSGQAYLWSPRSRRRILALGLGQRRPFTYSHIYGSLYYSRLILYTSLFFFGISLNYIFPLSPLPSWFRNSPPRYIFTHLPHFIEHSTNKTITSSSMERRRGGSLRRGGRIRESLGRRGRRSYLKFDTGGYGMSDRDQYNHGDYGVNMFPRPGRKEGGPKAGRFDFLSARYGLGR